MHFRTPVSLSLWNITKDYKTIQEADAQGIYTNVGSIIRRLLICYSFQLSNISMASLKRGGIACYGNKIGAGRFGTRNLTGQETFYPIKSWPVMVPHNLVFNAYWVYSPGVKRLTTHGCLLSRLRSSWTILRKNLTLYFYCTYIPCWYEQRRLYL